MELKNTAIIYNIFIILVFALFISLSYGIREEPANVLKTDISDYRTEPANSIIFGIGFIIYGILLIFVVIFRFTLLIFSPGFLEYLLIIIGIFVAPLIIAMAWVYGDTHTVFASIVFSLLILYTFLDFIVTARELDRTEDQRKPVKFAVFSMGFTSFLAFIFGILFAADTGGEYSSIFEWAMVFSLFGHIIALSTYYYYLP